MTSIVLQVLVSFKNDEVMMTSWVDIGAVHANGGSLVRLEEVVSSGAV